MLVPREKVRLFGDWYALLVAMTTNQDLDHVSDATMLYRSRFSHSFFDRRVNAQIKRGNFGLGHATHCILFVYKM